MDKSEIVTLNRTIMIKASEIYSTLKRRGELIGDADILIAASCLVRNMIIITNNENHFRRIDNLPVENWLI
jgi:predicted nucleic acid-binding protein